MIPKHVIQIWLQGKYELPPKEEGFTRQNEVLCNAYGYSYTFYDDSMIRTELPAHLLEKYDDTEVFAQKSDIARYYLLYKYGGIYIDADAFMIKPFDSEVLSKDFVICGHPYIPWKVNNGILACCKQSKIMKLILDHVLAADNKCKRNDFYCVQNSTGPWSVGKIFFENRDTENSKLLPYEYWEPCMGGRCKISPNTQVVHIHSQTWIKHTWLKYAGVLVALILLSIIYRRNRSKFHLKTKSVRR